MPVLSVIPSQNSKASDAVMLLSGGGRPLQADQNAIISSRFGGAVPWKNNLDEIFRGTG